MYIDATLRMELIFLVASWEAESVFGINISKLRLDNFGRAISEEYNIEIMEIDPDYDKTIGSKIDVINSVAEDETEVDAWFICAS